MINKFSHFGCFSVKNNDETCENITECFNLYNESDCAAVILCPHDGIEISKLILYHLKVALTSIEFSQLTENGKIKEFLEEMFHSFDKKYLKDADQYLRKRGLLNERLSKVELDSEIEELYKSLEELEKISKCGCTLSLSILHNNRLYIVNIGDNQIIIAMEDEVPGEHKFLLLTDEHNFYNEKEIQRIKNVCGLNASGLRNLHGKSYAKYHSRCLGHFEMKNEYMQIEAFRHSKAAPIICSPQISDGMKMNSKWCHLLLISSGLYYLVMELIYDRDKIAGEIANEFIMTKKRNPNKDLSEISEMVIYKYLNIYKKAFEQNSSLNLQEYNKFDHEELTIMVIKLFQTVNTQVSDLGNGSIETDENENKEIKFPFPYVSFDTWVDAESKLSEAEIEKFDLLFSISDSGNDLILEEDSKDF